MLGKRQHGVVKSQVIDRTSIIADGSTELWDHDPLAMERALERHDQVLRSAIESERAILAEVEVSANLDIDTSTTSTHELADIIRSRVDQREQTTLSVLVESFGFKVGIPADADFVFDLRSLPNPYWTIKLRGLTGLDTEVQAFLDAQDKFVAMYEDICEFLARWIPHYQQANRGYMTVAVGCTGGQHRSVHMTEKVAERLRDLHKPVQTRHISLRGARVNESQKR